jgi:Tfp pilus assembly protein PilF
LVSRGKSAESIPILDEIIAAEENGHKDEKRMMFAARTLTETLIYTSIAAEQNKSAVVFDDTWASAYWLKGFAMVDVGRGEEAKVYFDKAVALAPMNSQYLAERGEWFKSRKDWANAYRDFETASTAAAFSPDNGKSFEQRRAWRGMAFVRTEQGRLDEAEKLLRKCLELDPSDDNAKHELGYIASLRQKPN